MKKTSEWLVIICQLILQPLKPTGKLYLKALDDGSTNTSRQASELILC